jgi:hypothetical protein
MGVHCQTKLEGWINLQHEPAEIEMMIVSLLS